MLTKSRGMRAFQHTPPFFGERLAQETVCHRRLVIVDPCRAAGEPEPARLAERLFAVLLVAFFEGANLDRRARHRHVFKSKIE